MPRTLAPEAPDQLALGARHRYSKLLAVAGAVLRLRVEVGDMVAPRTGLLVWILVGVDEKLSEALAQMVVKVQDQFVGGDVLVTRIPNTLNFNNCIRDLKYKKI